ncbi:MAG: amidohydrolase family protein [Gammaproteobacteria bacterium]
MSIPPVIRSLGLLVLGVVLNTACDDTRIKTAVARSGTQFAVEGRAGHAHLYMDLQGMLWQLPAAGGEAIALTDPADDIRRPRLSPDGQRIVFQSFATGNWHIGIMNVDGSQRRLLTQGEHDHQEPAWEATGKSVMFASDRSGNYDLWSLDLVSNKLTQRTEHPADDYAPALAGDTLVFLSTRNGKSSLYQLMPGGETLERAVAPAGKIRAPRVSPDGKQVAYVQAIRRNPFPGVVLNELVVQDLKTGDTRVPSREGADLFNAAPAWLDNNRLLYTADGIIQQVSLSSDTTRSIDFTAALPLIESSYSPALPIAFSNDPQELLGLVDPVLLADEGILFNAVGDLWTLGAEGELTQLTDDAFVERDPALSPDQNHLAYISDRDGSMQIWIRNLTTGASERVTDKLPGPRYPTFSPDGRRLAFLQVGPIGTQDFSLRILDLETGNIQRLRKAPKVWPGRIGWNATGTHILLAELAGTSKRFSSGKNRLVSVNVAEDTATVIPLPDKLVPDAGPVISPDGKQLALVSNGTLWLALLNPDGSLAAPPAELLDELVDSPGFSTDSQRLLVLTNAGLESIDIVTGTRTLRNPSRRWRPAAPTGRQLVHAGRVFDGTGQNYQKNVDILIDGARIVSITEHREHPDDVTVIDAGGQSVVPGLIDHHTHFQPHQGEWVGRAWLAFGVTTVVEPGGLPYESREHFESWATGRRLGPRLVFAGPQLDGNRRIFHFASHINSEQRLVWELTRGERLGYGLLKTYTRMPPAAQARTVELGHALGLPVTAHAAFRNLGFGGDRIEHLRGSSRLSYSPKQSELLNSYSDIEQLLVQSGGAVTPTIVVAGGFIDYADQHPELLDNRQYAALYPPAARRVTASLNLMVGKNLDLVQRSLGNARATLKRLHDQGVPIVAGTDSPIFPYGLALIIELENYVAAGLTPAQALRTATVNAAAALGAQADVGQLKAGLLADLIIINGDPLTKVTDLMQVSGVMKNGNYWSVDELLSPPPGQPVSTAWQR